LYCPTFSHCAKECTRLLWFTRERLHQNRIAFNDWRTPQKILIKHWSTKTNFSPTSSKPIFTPRNNQRVRHVCIRCYTSDKCARKTCCLRTGVGMYWIARVFRQVLCFDRPLNWLLNGTH
jgi:hypothetical protein